MIQHLSLHINDDNRFVLPYISRTLPGVKIEEPGSDSATDFAIMLSSADIYGAGSLCNAAETDAIDTNSPHCAAEKAFAEWAAATNVPAVILRCADIIGTGMTGFPRELANAIWRGTFFHFPGNEAQRSAIHASDLAAIVAALAEANAGGDAKTEIYNVADGSDPTVHALAEALAFRMSNKRISTLSTRPQQWFGRVVYGKKKYAAYTTSRTVSTARLAAAIAYSTTPVCEYLRTHNYDESSL